MNDPTSLKNEGHPASSEWSPEDIAAFIKAEDERDKDHEDLGKLARENGFGCPADSEAPDKSKPKDDTEDSDDSDDSSDDK
jgi:hypothetical protein